MALHPGWWFNLLTTEPLTFASLTGSDGTVAELIDKVFDPSVTLDDLAWLRGVWPRPLIVKGIQTVDDAAAVVDRGADAIVVSNHGGRQLDRAPTPLEQLPAIVAGGRRPGRGLSRRRDHDRRGCCRGRGMGARACLVGRAYLYGLMAGGERGVQRSFDILRRELVRTMQLLGVTGVAELGPRADPDPPNPRER